MKTLKEMVDEYNSLTGESVRRFPDRATAERRLAQAKIDYPEIHEDRRSLVVPLTRYQSCAVEVNGERYDSTLQAFKALELPIGKHQRFRKELRKKGVATFNGALHFKVVL